MSISIDESGWPLVVIRWASGPVSSADIDAFLQVSSRHLALHQRWITLHEGVETSWMDGAQRERMAAHVNAHRAEFAKWHVAVAIVTASSIARAVITSINWVSPPPSKQRTFAGRAEAEAWLRAELTSASESQSDA